MEEIDFESATRYKFTKDKLEERLELSGYSKEDIDKIILDYNKRLLFYLTVLDTDKHPENIAFIKEKKRNSKIKLSPNYDSEFSLLLERDKEMVKFFVEQPHGVEEEAEVQDPKIGAIVRKEDGGWDEMWRDTLEILIEDNDEVYDYYNNNLRGKIDMDLILQRVEKRINAPLPDDVKNIAKRAYKSRNEKIEKIMNGELEIDENKQNTFDFSTMLNNLINKGIQTSIRTGEQIDVGEKMKEDMDRKKTDDKDILNNFFQSLDD